MLHRTASSDKKNLPQSKTPSYLKIGTLDCSSVYYGNAHELPELLENVGIVHNKPTDECAPPGSVSNYVGE